MQGSPSKTTKFLFQASNSSPDLAGPALWVSSTTTVPLSQPQQVVGQPRQLRWCLAALQCIACSLHKHQTAGQGLPDHCRQPLQGAMTFKHVSQAMHSQPASAARNAPCYVSCRPCVIGTVLLFANVCAVSSASGTHQGDRSGPHALQCQLQGHAGALTRLKLPHYEQAGSVKQTQGVRRAGMQCQADSSRIVQAWQCCPSALPPTFEALRLAYKRHILQDHGIAHT